MLQQALNNTNKDVEVSQPPNDGVSSLSFAPVGSLLAATSWDNQTRVWQMDGSGMTQPKGSITHDMPPLASCWHSDGTKVFSAGCDKQAKMLDLNTQQTTTVAMHDAPIKTTHWLKNEQILMTCSWDKTVKYWDTRSQQPAITMQLRDKAYASDVVYPLAVIACADRNNMVYDLRTPNREYKVIQSHLKYQTRCLACFPDQSGFAIGSIEGRVAIQHIDDKQAESKNFSFKCHRDDNDIYAVNSIAFHPVYHTFSTAGSDGTLNFWDKDSKQRLKNFSKMGRPISCSAFNSDGSIFAYALSYDWSKGHTGYNPNVDKNQIFLHPTLDQEVRPKNRVGGRK
eukprot:Nk52_evm7s218 gene=Nk52_evmTU7s218